jgi:CIC family chloride channel protein
MFGSSATSANRGEQDFRSGPLFMVMVAIACGAAGAIGAVFFRFLIRLFQGLFFFGWSGVENVVAQGLLAEPGDPLEFVGGLPLWVMVLAPALGGLVVGPLVYFFAREAKGHGVPEVMEAVALRGGVMRPRVVAVKTFASALCIGSGGSVGREGPIVQIGSAIGSVIGQLLRVNARQLRTIVGCGAAAGVSATFNAPIAGALFAVEVIVGDFAVSQFSPIVISSVVATVISRFLLGNHPAFEVPPYELVSPFEIVAYMGVGVVAALVGLAFVSVLYRSEDLWDRLRVPEWSKAAIGGALIGCIALLVPNVYGVGYSTITQALNGELAVSMLAILLVAKIVATSTTIGSGGSGGVFAPSLFLGAVTGGLFGSIVHQWFPESTASSGAYALVTMGAVVAATTHAPITAILIIFELTQSITIIPPLMAACVVSTLLATFLRNDSIYTRKLLRRGVSLRPDEDPNALRGLWVRDAIDREPATISDRAGIGEIVELLVESDHSVYFVIDGEGQLIGTIDLRDVRQLLLERDVLSSVVVARDLCEHDVPSVNEDDNLDVVMQIFSLEEVEELAVVAAKNPRRLMGSIHKRDAIQALNRETARRDLAGGLSSTVAVVEKVREVELGGGYVVRDVPAPHRFIGHSLAELEIRARTGVQVLLIRSPQGSTGSRDPMRVPSATDRIQAGDILVVAGSREGLDHMERM